MFVMFMSVIDPVWNGIEIIETLIKSIQKIVYILVMTKYYLKNKFVISLANSERYKILKSFKR